MGQARDGRIGRHGVESFSTTDPDGTVGEREFPLPQSLSNVKRGFSEKKWTLGQKQTCQDRKQQHRPCEKQKPDPTVARANKRLTSSFYQLKTGHCLTGQRSHMLSDNG